MAVEAPTPAPAPVDPARSTKPPVSIPDPVAVALPGEEHLEWELILDTMSDDGFLKDPRKIASGDDVDLGGRAACLLKLTRGLQAQARHESWKKRQVGLPGATSAEEERGAGKT